MAKMTAEERVAKANDQCFHRGTCSFDVCRECMIKSICAAEVAEREACAAIVHGIIRRAMTVGESLLLAAAEDEIRWRK